MKKTNGFKSFMRKLDGLPEADYYDGFFYRLKDIFYSQVRMTNCRKFLEGDISVIDGCFLWSATPQGRKFWEDVRYREQKPTEEHFAYVRWFMEQMELNR